MSLRSLTYTLQRILLRPFMTAKSSIYNVKLKFKSEDVVGRYIYKYDVYEPETTSALLSEIQFQDGDVALDVGANIGWYSLILARRGISVHAFEPDPLNHKLLKHNAGLNSLEKNIHAHLLAVSEKNTTMPLYLYPDKNRGRHSLNAMDECEKINVNVVKLDDFLEQQNVPLNKIRLLKMDIEGHELPALKGAEHALHHIPYLLVEHAPEHIRRGGFDPEEVINFLISLKFIPYRIGKNGLEKTSAEELAEDDREQNIFWKKESLSEASHSAI